MSKNRLNLDFSLSTKAQRIQYIESYLNVIPFEPTSAEIETMSNYILWGTSEIENGDPTSGPTVRNGRQEGIELETRYKTWDSNGRVESLDALIESPGFNEASLRDPRINPPTKAIHQKLSRSEIRHNAPPNSLQLFEALWEQIDETEFLLNQYEILNGKRTEVRPELLRRISPQTQLNLQQKASTLLPYSALKLKHELVELRREQYALKDSFAPTLLTQPSFNHIELETSIFGEDIEVFPLRLWSSQGIGKKIWRDDRFAQPEDFAPEDLEALSSLLWMRPAPSKRYFNFGDEEHLYLLYQYYEELEDAANAPENENLRKFLKTLGVYEKLADLEPFLYEILRSKIRKKTNQQICEVISTQFGKKYQPNYISTLYCKKCLAQIAAAAKTHREVLENVFFPENFKKCKDCGRVLLLSEENFVKRHRSNDGFSPRCKKCEKIKRDSKGNR